MTDETPAVEDETEDETEEYEPEILNLNDGELVIFDHVAFMEAYGALAIQYRDGGLYVLRSKCRWVNVDEMAEKPEKGGKLASVKGVVLAAP